MKKENNIMNQLENINKNGAFKVPENYFDTFQSKMVDRIAAEETKKSAQTAYPIPKLRLVPLIAIVGIILIVISLVWVVPVIRKPGFTDNELAEIYRYQAIDATSESDLIHELETLSQEKERKDSTLTNKTVLTDEAIDVLSNDNNIDINSIIDAL